MTAETVDNVLLHFGVKGMKWGVRKERSPAEQARRAADKAEKKRANAEMDAILTRRFALQFGKQMTEEDYQRLSDKGKTFAEGHQLKRIVAKKNKDADDRYVSTNEQDAINYRVGLGRSFLNKGERHEITLKAVNKLSSPSEKERVDAFVQLMDEPAIQLRNGKTITGREYLKRQGMGRDVRRLDSHQLGLKYYNDFLTEQWTNAPINTAYFDIIAKKGYNALIDDNDAGILSSEPLILLNPKSDVVRMRIDPLTPEQIKAAERQLRAPEL